MTKKEYSELTNGEPLICMAASGGFTIGCVYRVEESTNQHPVILNDNYYYVMLSWTRDSQTYPFYYNLFERVKSKEVNHDSRRNG
jgi:hypothetical protein